jgi:hypothetical protein
MERAELLNNEILNISEAQVNFQKPRKPLCQRKGQKHWQVMNPCLVKCWTVKE